MSSESPGICAICGGELGTVLLVHDKPDRFERHVGVPEEGYKRVWRECTLCGSATNCHEVGNSVRLRELGESYYEVDFAGTSPEEKFRKVMDLPAGRSDNAGRVERILSKICQLGMQAEEPLRAVDVGAGLGVFLARLLDAAEARGLMIDATAVEPDPVAVEHLERVGRFNVIEGLFTGQQQFAGAKLITFNKVLEHVAAPNALLGDASRVLDPKCGMLYMEVPDVATIGNRLATDNILGALHHNLYTPEGVALLLRRSGLMVLEVSRVFEPSGKLTVFGFAVLPPHMNRLGKR